MFFDARQFEKNLKVLDGLNKDLYKAIAFTDRGVGLKLIDARTYGGVIRFFTDAKGGLLKTGSTCQPMRIRDPFRFAELASYRITTQLELKELPPGVVATVIPTEELANEGFNILPTYFTSGKVEFTVTSLRKMEISPDYPVAILAFIPVQQLEDVPALSNELKDENVKKKDVSDKSDTDLDNKLNEEKNNKKTQTDKLPNEKSTSKKSTPTTKSTTGKSSKVSTTLHSRK